MWTEQDFEDLWIRLRHQAEWSEGFVFFLLYVQSAESESRLLERLRDATHLRTSRVEWLVPDWPASQPPPDLSQALIDLVLGAAQCPGSRFAALHAPLWISLAAPPSFLQAGPVGQEQWNLASRALLSKLNAGRSQLERDCKRPMILALGEEWYGKVPSVAPDLWSIARIDSLVRPVAGHRAASIGDMDDGRQNRSAELVSSALGKASDYERTLADTWARRDKTDRAGLTPELPMRLAELALERHAIVAAAGYAKEAIDIARRRIEAVGETPQALDDLAVSLERLAAEPSVVVIERRSSIAEALAIRQRLETAMPQTGKYALRLVVTRQIAASIGVSPSSEPNTKA